MCGAWAEQATITQTPQAWAHPTGTPDSASPAPPPSGAFFSGLRPLAGTLSLPTAALPHPGNTTTDVLEIVLDQSLDATLIHCIDQSSMIALRLIGITHSKSSDGTVKRVSFA